MLDAHTPFPAPLRETDIASHDWRRPGPHVLDAWHGTTHDFDTFTLDRAHHDAQFGSVLYFTSSEDDARENYANPEGPDLKNRVETEQERISEQIWDDPESVGLDADADGEAIAAKAAEIARQRHVGLTSRMIPVRLTLTRPFVVDAAGLTRLQLFDGPSSWEQALDEVAEDLGIAPDDLDHDTHEEALYLKSDEIRDKRYLEVSDALLRVCYRLGCEFKTPNFGDEDLEDIFCDRFERLFREDEQFIYLENEEGDLVSCSVLSQLLEELGYDSIVLLNADRRFTTMTMPSATTHIHLMKPAPEMITML